jgi:hypothetical protein
MPASESTLFPSCRQTYALRLSASGHDPTVLRGEVEHVLSGERQAFDSASGLLAALAVLQARALAGETEGGERGGR